MNNYCFAVVLCLAFLHIHDVSTQGGRSCTNYCPSSQQRCSVCCRDLGYDAGQSACRGATCNCQGGNPIPIPQTPPNPIHDHHDHDEHHDHDQADHHDHDHDSHHDHDHGVSGNTVTAFAEFKSRITGTLTLTQTGNGPVRLQGSLIGLPPNTLHGFHVHEFGDLRKGCASTGGHFNPGGHHHGSSTDKDAKRHVGDLGNIRVNANGVAVIDFSDSVVSLSGPNSVLGRAFVIHEREDDLGKGGTPDSLETGNAGPRVDCAVIAFAK